MHLLALRLIFFFVAFCFSKHIHSLIHLEACFAPMHGLIFCTCRLGVRMHFYFFVSKYKACVIQHRIIGIIQTS